MQIIDELLPKENKIYDKLEEYYDPQDIMMFDIETTGLSASSSFIYIIGYNIKMADGWHIIQLFNDDGESEPEIISHFMRELARYKYLIEFNGDSFDVPYVKKRLELINRRQGLDIPDNFEKVQQIDLYKLIRPFKKALGLANMKQKTIERFLGIDRIDQMNGGELIYVYFNYLTDKTVRERSLLLQHNRDDMEGMFFLTDIFALKKLSEGRLNFSGMEMINSNQLRLKLSFKPEYALGLSFAATDPLLIVSGKADDAYISLPVSKGVFKYFYKDYKNYNYYPELDAAYHKDLASTLTDYTSCPAKASNCYTRLEGFFIKKYGFTEGQSFFPDDKESTGKADAYIELSDEFLSDTELLNDYIRHVVHTIMTGSKTR
ncbi:MAG: ribonuclease H-like domain-containing protein [Eubacterium sp.]|nr:ribonuclease H-like domain-containing protein [Eubacterium sp.]